MPLVVQMGKLATKTAKIIYETTGERSIGVFDAYFSKSTMFNTTNAMCTEDGKPILRVVTRAQDSYVGYMPGEQAVPGQKRRPGRPKKDGKNVYGEKIHLKSLLKDRSNFTKTTMKLYGKNTAVEYLCLDLLWKQTDSVMRFVVLSSNRGQCILMTDDLTLTPEEIITIYCLRFKIETSFDEQKNDMGCFDYHFWSSAQPKFKKWKKTVSTLSENSLSKINNARKATQSFVCLATIATGIITIIAFSHNRDIWNRYPGWIRTRRSDIPTAAIVKDTLLHDFLEFQGLLPSLHLFNFILPLQRFDRFLYRDVA
jgi:hypothetical protein